MFDRVGAQSGLKPLSGRGKPCDGSLRCVTMPKRAKKLIVFWMPLTQNEVVNTRSLLMTSFAVLCAATAAAGQATPPTPARPPLGEIRGRLTDSVAGRAIASGSVAVRRVGDSAFASGALPKEDGSFRVDGLAPGRYTLRIRAIGFAPVVRNDIAIAAEKPIVDVGAIALERRRGEARRDTDGGRARGRGARAGSDELQREEHAGRERRHGDRRAAQHSARRSRRLEQREPARQRERRHADQRPLDAAQGRSARRVPRAAARGHGEERRSRDESVGEGRPGRHRRHHQHRAQSGSASSG